MPEAAQHFVNRAGWLRAAVLGANDGIISTASLIVGVASVGGGDRVAAGRQHGRVARRARGLEENTW